MAPSGPPYSGIDWDDELEKSPAARRALVKGHLAAEEWLRRSAKSETIDLRLIQGLHRIIFGRVWPDFAGRLRGPHPPYIHRNVTFGNRRGVEADYVPDACRQLVSEIAGLVRQLDELASVRATEDFREDVLTVAAYAHCELIRIHPFDNGNGRVARTVMNYFAARYDFLPIPFERPKGQYTAAIGVWLDYNNLDGFMDFLRPSFRRALDRY